MTDIQNPVTELSEDRCWDLLAGQKVGRLATALNGVPDMRPVNYAVDGESIVFRTAEGTKLFELTVNDDVVLEIDQWNDDFGWSVLARGHAAVITDEAELARAAKLRLRPWVPTVKPIWVRVDVSEVTGRRFDFGPDPIEQYRW